MRGLVVLGFGLEVVGLRGVVGFLGVVGLRWVVVGRL